MMTERKEVDSFKFTGGVTKRMLKNWIKLESPRPIPWTLLNKPLSEARVALLSSAAVALKTDKPFDQDGERQNPWWGDPSYRRLPSSTKTEDVELYHLHINPYYAKQDLNVLFPIEHLNQMAAEGEIGSAAAQHYSVMGYIIEPEEQLQKTAPAIIEDLKADHVDVLLLAPA